MTEDIPVTEGPAGVSRRGLLGLALGAGAAGIAIGASAGTADDSTFGSVSADDGCHQPSQRLVA